MSWILKYIPDLVTGKFTIEEVARLRGKEIGKEIDPDTVRKALNKAGYTTRNGRISPKKEIKKEKKVRFFVCSNCIYYNITCNTPHQVKAGWTKDLEKGFCEYKRVV